MSPFENSPEEVLQYIGDVEYPASTQDLLDAARVRGAPEDVVEQLKALGTQQFAEPTAISAALRRPQETDRTEHADESVRRPE